MLLVIGGINPYSALVYAASRSCLIKSYPIVRLPTVAGECPHHIYA